MVLTAESKPIFKDVIVTPLDARREAIGLLAALSVIGILMAVRFAFVQTTETQTQLKSYQRFDTTLTGQSPVLYRSLLSVIDELIYLRKQSGSWPEIALLEAQHLPPFDKTFLPVGLKDYEWSRHVGKSWVDYFARRSPSKEVGQGVHEQTVFLLRIIDLHTKDHPHPHFGVDYDPNLRFASQVWMYPEDRAYTPDKQLPEKGWKWIISAAPFSRSAGAPVISEEPDSIEITDMLEELEK